MLTDVFFYNFSRWTEIKLEEIEYYLQKNFRNLSFNNNKNDNRLSRLFHLNLNLAYFQSKCIVQNIKRELDSNQILPFKDFPEDHFMFGIKPICNQEYYLTRFQDFILKENLLLYDGILLQKLYQEILCQLDFEVNLSELHIIITDKLLGSFDDIDWKYHARSVIFGNPTILSTSGLIYGPARPKEYYLKVLYHSRDPELLAEVENEYRGKFIEYNDNRINSIIEGLSMQSICYMIEGDPFCNDSNCRLFNSHWQEELIRLNLNTNICKKHLKIIKNNTSRLI
ncbi:MAG: hypothetical protein MRJ93_01430 [Nitrososphaeraceae archaeon]|nr:hypothetical protein [Nitrososphaeraceae archaeon]